MGKRWHLASLSGCAWSYDVAEQRQCSHSPQSSSFRHSSVALSNRRRSPDGRNSRFCRKLLSQAATVPANVVQGSALTVPSADIPHATLAATIATPHLRCRRTARFRTTRSARAQAACSSRQDRVSFVPHTRARSPQGAASTGERCTPTYNRRSPTTSNSHQVWRT